MRELPSDLLKQVVFTLPSPVRFILENVSASLFVAGGFVRDVYFGITPKDIDIWTGLEFDDLRIIVKNFVDVASTACDYKIESTICTDHSITVNIVTTKETRVSVQFIHNWVFPNVNKVIESFDFTCCQAGIVFDCGWRGVCTEGFLQDTLEKRLVYTSPIRIEHKAGSLKRVLKFVSRGWKIRDEELAKVLARAAGDLIESEEKAVAYFKETLPLKCSVSFQYI